MGLHLLLLFYCLLLLLTASRQHYRLLDAFSTCGAAPAAATAAAATVPRLARVGREAANGFRFCARPQQDATSVCPGNWLVKKKYVHSSAVARAYCRVKETVSLRGIP